MCNIPKSILYKLVSEYRLKDNDLFIYNTNIIYNVNDWVLIFKYANIIDFNKAQIGQITRIDINTNFIHNKIYIKTIKNKNLLIYKNNIDSCIIYNYYLNNLLVIKEIKENKMRKDMFKTTNLIIRKITNKVIIWN